MYEHHVCRCPGVVVARLSTHIMLTCGDLQHIYSLGTCSRKVQVFRRPPKLGTRHGDVFVLVATWKVFLITRWGVKSPPTNYIINLRVTSTNLRVDRMFIGYFW